MGCDTMLVSILIFIIPVSVEGGGQHTVVIKIEPGLEEESGTSDTQKGTSDTQTGTDDTQTRTGDTQTRTGDTQTGTSDTQKEQSQVNF